MTELQPGATPNKRNREDHVAQAERWDEQNQRARQTLGRRLGALRDLFGDAVYAAIERPLDNVAETASERDWHREQETAQTVAALRSDCHILRGQAHAMHRRAWDVASSLWALHDRLDALTVPDALFLLDLHDASPAKLVDWMHRQVREQLEALELRRPGEEEPF